MNYDKVNFNGKVYFIPDRNQDKYHLTIKIKKIKLIERKDYVDIKITYDENDPNNNKIVSQYIGVEIEKYKAILIKERIG